MRRHGQAFRMVLRPKHDLFVSVFSGWAERKWNDVFSQFVSSRSHAASDHHWGCLLCGVTYSMSPASAYSDARKREERIQTGEVQVNILARHEFLSKKNPRIAEQSYTHPMNDLGNDTDPKDSHSDRIESDFVENLSHTNDAHINVPITHDI